LSKKGTFLTSRHLDPARNIEASIASLRGDNGPLRAMLDGMIRAEPLG
jgi:hypothetical protein